MERYRSQSYPLFSKTDSPRSHHETERPSSAPAKLAFSNFSVKQEPIYLKDRDDIKKIMREIEKNPPNNKERTIALHHELRKKLKPWSKPEKSNFIGNKEAKRFSKSIRTLAGTIGTSIVEYLKNPTNFNWHDKPNTVARDAISATNELFVLDQT